MRNSFKKVLIDHSVKLFTMAVLVAVRSLVLTEAIIKMTLGLQKDFP
jgi:hypothetical protein